MDYMMKWRDTNFKTKKEQNIDFELQQRNNICNEMISIKRTSTEWVKTKKKSETIQEARKYRMRGWKYLNDICRKWTEQYKEL